MKIPSIAPGATTTAISLMGAGALVIWPNVTWIGISLIAIGALVFVLGVRFDGSGVHLWRWRDRKWWEGLQSVSIRKAGCIVAGIPPATFEKSERAQAVADVILQLVNEGHMPLALERKSAAGIFSSIGSDLGDSPYGPYGRKSVDGDAMISVRSLEGIARGRGWKLPWPIPAQ